MGFLIGYTGPDAADVEPRLVRELPSADHHTTEVARGSAHVLVWSGPPGGGFSDGGDEAIGAIGAWLSRDAIGRRGRALRAYPAEPVATTAHAVIAVDDEGARLLRDEVGTVPLYARRYGSGWLVGSSALALARIAPRCGLSWEGAAQFLTFGQLLDIDTLYADVVAVPAGELWMLSGAGISVSRVEPPAWRVDASVTPAEFDAAVARAVSSRPGMDREAIFLSGGLDSRYIAAHLARRGAKARAVTFGRVDAPDMKIAPRVAATLRLEHTCAPTSPDALGSVLPDAVRLVDGMVGATHLHGSETLGRFVDSVDTLWNGFAGDAIVGGSFSHPRYARSTDVAGTLARGVRALPGDSATAVVDRARWREVGDRPRHVLARVVAEISGATPAERAHRFLMRERVGRLAAGGLGVDRHYVPVSCPYAHAPVLGMAARLTAADRAHSRLLRRALTRHATAVAGEVWPRTGLSPAAPVAIAAGARWVQRVRSRVGWSVGDAVIDYAAWMRGPWRNLRSRWLRRLAEEEGFDADALRARAARSPRHDEVAFDGVLISIAIACDALGS